MRLIDADEVMKTAFRDTVLINGVVMQERLVLAETIETAQTIDAEPVRHGHWINAYPDIEPNPMFMYGICSKCGFEQGLSNKLNYCPNCGAKMDE